LFESDRSGRDQLYLMRSDGSHQHRITHDSLRTDDPVFFPSGRKIAFAVTKADNSDSDIFTSNDYPSDWARRG
jgi:Tol biopolymer transport system component